MSTDPLHDQPPPADGELLASPTLVHDPYAALRHRNYRYFAGGNILGVTGWQMLSVAVGYELYQRTDSKTALGLVGLFQFAPLLLAFLPAGHAIDRFGRKSVVMASLAVLTVTGLLLATASFEHNHIPHLPLLLWLNTLFQRLAHRLTDTSAHFDDPYVPVMYGLLLINATARAFNQPARQALLPQLVPAHAFPNAVTWNSSLFEVCSMVGPAIAGLLIGAMESRRRDSPWVFSTVYAINAGCQAGQFLMLLAVRVVTPPRPREKATLRSLSAGIRYVWVNQIILATMTLDLFAVVLGGATILLPAVAKDVLHVGPVGFGWLRSAPSVGASLTAVLLAHLPPMRKAGRNLLWAVAGFGVATVVLGVSRSFWISLLALALTGAFDNVSVVVRATLVQILTPDAMRGRVSAVSSIFIGTSNQIGGLESGLTAAALGTAPSIVLGGLATLAVVGAAAALWPQLRRFGPLRPPAELAT